ncbi:TetR/AcrR family transcriptional regulator [Streptomyces sp. SID14515]|uniref:TetR/AcrR family transcriptional regulator n=1 Tax=Streptomyces sp. SID14515 TaxID=2706074 RepID=UPI0013CACB63|nr:TetR/AcrR family transcriptional regulator [Streptomyces sp. SID14515]NEB36508.1 TetR/AcrR family transcriptional regulator [Streptomyces sp. SID14515]
MDGLQVGWGAPRPERADAARNRVHLLATARQMLAESGPDQLTMDALAERSGLGKGTVFRRFGTRAGIFQALLDEIERGLQERVMSGPPPLGPGAPPVERLVAFGRARVRLLIENTEIARFALDGRQPLPSNPRTPASQMHIRMLLRQLSLDGADLDLLAIQLTAALDGPLLLYLSADALTNGPQIEESLGSAWQDLIERVCRP